MHATITKLKLKYIIFTNILKEQIYVHSMFKKYLVNCKMQQHATAIP